MAIFVTVEGGVVTSVHDEYGQDLEYTLEDYDDGFDCDECGVYVQTQAAVYGPPEGTALGNCKRYCAACAKELGIKSREKRR